MCDSQVNAFFSRLTNSGQNSYGSMDLLLYLWGILLSVLSCQSLCYLKMLGDFYFGQGVVLMYGNIDFLLFTNMLKAPIQLYNLKISTTLLVMMCETSKKVLQTLASGSMILHQYRTCHLGGSLPMLSR